MFDLFPWIYSRVRPCFRTRFGITFIVFYFFSFVLGAQSVTGIWRGNIINGKGLKKQSSAIEVKLVANGNTIVGTVYYYGSKTSYIRYNLKGTLKENGTSVYWQDSAITDKYIRKKNEAHEFSETMKYFLSHSMDGDSYKLGGTSKLPKMDEMKVDLDRVEQTFFPDEWDPILTDYYSGNTVTPAQMDSVLAIAYLPDAPKQPEVKTPEPVIAKAEPSSPPPPPISVEAKPEPEPPTINDALNNRKKIVQTIIPVVGDTIELRFYDNAEVDGDSISLFVNSTILFEHVFLKEKPHIYKLCLKNLGQTVDLTMVAENLGILPPNTAFMVAFSGGKRHTARIESNENSSGVIRLVRMDVEEPTTSTKSP